MLHSYDNDTSFFALDAEMEATQQRGEASLSESLIDQATRRGPYFGPDATAKVHEAGHPVGNKQRCTRCGALITDNSRRPANWEPSFWRPGALVRFVRGGSSVVTPTEALNTRQCGRLAKRYGRPVCVETDFVCPPIPIRSFDWAAWEDGREEAGPVGRGATREEAVARLFDQIEAA